MIRELRDLSQSMNRDKVFRKMRFLLYQASPPSGSLEPIAGEPGQAATDLGFGRTISLAIDDMIQELRGPMYMRKGVGDLGDLKLWTPLTKRQALRRSADINSSSGRVIHEISDTEFDQITLHKRRRDL